MAVPDRLGDRHGLVIAGIGQGVVNKIVDHLTDLQRISLNKGLSLLLEANDIAVLFRQLAVTGQNFPNGTRQGETLGVFLRRGVLALAVVQHRVHQCGQAVGLIQNDLQILGSIFSGNILHDLHIAFDQGQGRAQVMTDIGDQLPLSLLHLTQIPGRLRELPVQLGDLPVGVCVGYRRVFALTQGAGCFRGSDNGAGNFPGQDGG